MLFGGKLASILVCDACKKISITYEDFNDLSLSIKPEDYVKARKRDRFKHIARKLRFKPKDVEKRETSPSSPHRSSSVPASPARRSMDPQPHEEPINVDHRRRSFDHVRDPDGAEVEAEAREEVRELARETVGEAKASALSSPAVEIEEVEPAHAEKPNAHVAFAEAVKDKKEKEKEDGWGKLGRRLSMSMGMAKKDKRLSRSRERGWKGIYAKDSDTSRAPSEERSPPLSSAKIATQSQTGSSSEVVEAIEAKNRVITPSPVASPLSTPPLNISRPLPNFRRHSAMSVVEKPPKPARPPKPTRQETAYLRRLLADVHATPSTFAMLQQAISGGSQSGSVPSSPVMSAQALLAKLGHMPGIEECLRLFTAVEVLDGDNMVGCHRCWKIANGTYKPRRKEEEEDDSEESAESPVIVPEAEELVAQMTRRPTRESSPEPSGRISPASTSYINGSAASSSIFLHETASVSSAPTTIQSVPPDPRLKPISGTLQLPSPPRTPDAPPESYGGLPIPSISTTEPESPGSTPNTARPPVLPTPPRASTSNASLEPPKPKKRKSSKQSQTQDDSDSSSDDGYDTSDASDDGSSYSDASSVASASPSGSRRTSLDKPNGQATPSQPDQRAERKVPRSEQVIMRRTFKRYLVAVPPPVLVIHLKRFQQVSKTNPYAMAFSSGFKKLDDFVAFPEYLDLAPFLAPSPAEYGLRGKHKKEKAKARDERCMYRLYAVVVHIGNMVSCSPLRDRPASAYDHIQLGGHYIAYTALPPSRTHTETPKSETAPLPGSSSAAGSEKQPPRRWAYISDTVVRLTTLEEVLKAKAYICMYERI